MKKKLMALALVSAMVLGLTACGGGASSSAPAGDAGTGEAAAPAATASTDGDIRLVNGKIEVDAALKAAAAAYKEETGVSVAIESMGGGVNIQDTLKGYYQADNMPDIFVCGSDADFGNWTGLLADLSNEPWAADTDAGYKDADGKIIGFPYTTEAIGLAYNASILEAAGIALAPNGSIPVDDNYQIVNRKSSNCNCFAIGDVNGRQMLAHAAEAQALRVINNIMGHADGIRFDIMPAAIFTEPEAACVGPTEDQLKAQGVAYTCKKSFWRANGKALAMNATEGMLKLFCDADGVILGCHAYGAHSADIVQEVSVLMCKHTTLSELADMVHIHPTLSEILKSAAEI